MEFWEKIASLPEKEFNEYIEKIRKCNPNSNTVAALEATRNSIKQDIVLRNSEG